MELPDGGMKWIMKFSYSLMQNANGVSADLAASTIDSGFAKTMAEDVVRHPIIHDSSRPWGWFNTQNQDEWVYFNKLKSFKGDTDAHHVFEWTGDGVGIILTKYQYDTLCPPNSPSYVTCGN